MRWLRALLLILACLSLLVFQLSGLHMHVHRHVHVDAEGYRGTLQHIHVHRVDVPGNAALNGQAADLDHDHAGSPLPEGERDISIVKLSSSAVKVLIYFVGLCLSLLIISKRPGRIAVPAEIPLRKTRRVRWRPPLRAPPLPIGP